MGCECSECYHSGKSRKVLLISAALLAAGIYMQFTDSGLHLIPLLLAVAVSGYSIFRGAFRSLRHGRFSVDFLMTVAVIGAILLGDYAEAALVTVLFYLAEYLEEYAGERSERSVESLIRLRPAEARVIEDGAEGTRSIDEVRKGDVIAVRGGDSIPLDGIIIRGTSRIDQSNITGESIPVKKGEGDEVFAGTQNLDGYLEIEVTRTSRNTILSRVIETVRRSALRRSRREKFIERFASIYTPAVMVLAVLTASVPIILGYNPMEWIYRALVLLVISCPCALLISTPVAMVSGMTSAAGRGILVKGSEFLEKMASVNTVLFDKTGTLTEGSFEVLSVEPGERSEEILRIAASLESRSSHPIAEAITGAYSGETYEVDEFRSVMGRGVSGRINGRTYTIGSPELFNEGSDGKGTTVLLADEDGVMGRITMGDQLRESAPLVMEKLGEKGIETMMVTGDHEGVASEIASGAGIRDYRAGLFPEDKMRIINEMASRGTVAMVGDGVNDAPALAAADVGIAMGVRGSDVALETADVTLVEDDLERIDELIDLSRRTIRTVKLNTGITVTVKLSLAVFSILGFVPLWLAVAAGDVGLSLFVIVNSLLAGRV